MKKNISIADIGNRIKQVRKELGVRQKEMAAALEISPTYLSEIENGRAKPGPEIFLKLATIYGMDLQYLFLGKDGISSKNEKSPAITEVKITQEIDSIEELIWLMENSPFIRNSIMSLASKFLLENATIIRELLNRDKNKEFFG